MYKLIKSINKRVRMGSHTLTFNATDLSQTSPIAYNGILKYLRIVIPNFTNAVTSTVTLVDAAARVYWTSAAKARNASYNLETEAEWKEQYLSNDLLWKVTLSGVAGGTGGVITLIPRYYGTLT